MGSVVIVDDNRDNADSLAVLLQMQGFKVHVAYDGESGFALVEAVCPGAAILDIGLPGISGYELARRIRAKFGPAMPLVAMSGWDTPTDVRQAWASRFDHHLTKPADPDEVVALLRAYEAERLAARGVDSADR